MTAPSQSALPPVQRVVTGHDERGLAIFKTEDVEPTTIIPSGDAAVLLVWATATVPADNQDETDGRTRDAGLTIDQGSVIRIVDMMPGRASPMHRTNSIDYGIVLDGEIELELDGGERRTVGRGGIIIQRGTNHLWRNASDTPCRVAFVLIEAAPVTIDGRVLEEIHP